MHITSNCTSLRVKMTFSVQLSFGSELDSAFKKTHYFFMRPNFTNSNALASILSVPLTENYHYQNCWIINVWGGIVGENVVVPYFFTLPVKYIPNLQKFYTNAVTSRRSSRLLFVQRNCFVRKYLMKIVSF